MLAMDEEEGEGEDGDGGGRMSCGEDAQASRFLVRVLFLGRKGIRDEDGRCACVEMIFDEVARLLVSLTFDRSPRIRRGSEEEGEDAAVNVVIFAGPVALAKNDLA